MIPPERKQLDGDLRAPSGPVGANAPGGRVPPPNDDESTGLPWPRSWRGVYLFVLGCFVTYVVLLTAFGRYFA